MLFKQNVLSAIALGDVTMAFRRWRKPTVRAGGTLRTAVGVLAIDAVEEIDPQDITEKVASAAGYPSRQAVVDEMTGDVGRVYQIRFRLIGEDPRIALRSDAPRETSDLEAIAVALKRLDRTIVWTRRVLELIEERPGVVAQILADASAMERVIFKRRVRQLKELGLTESLAVGYRLSPRGEAVLEYIRVQEARSSHGA
ncbi:MAG TPA: hypothetical protein VGQ76_10410 [Thermoanaerobaculia bacterium]|jgi:hypothetical protein|nr:hypothetical protein [Thermoanaerobaculia bacterium]